MDLTELLAANFAEHGEAAVYIKASDSSERAIVVIPDREPPAPLSPAPSVKTPRMTVMVLANASNGITPTEIEVGRDLIRIAPVYGGATKDLVIGRIVASIPGQMTLEL